MNDILFVIIVFLISGVFAGALSGLLGIGGGLIFVPTILIVIDLFVPALVPVKTTLAVATSFLLIVFTQGTSAITHFSHIKNIESRPINVLLWIFLVTLGSGLGILIQRYIGVPELFLRWLFGIWMFLLCILFLVKFQNSHQKKAIKVIHFRKLALYSILLSIGGISGSLGISGGTMLMPLLASIGILPFLAVSFSSLIGIALSLVSFLVYLLSSYIFPLEIEHRFVYGYFFLPALAMLVTSIPSARIAGNLISAIDKKWLYLLGGILFFFISLQTISKLI